MFVETIQRGAKLEVAELDKFSGRYHRILTKEFSLTEQELKYTIDISSYIDRNPYFVFEVCMFYYNYLVS